MQQQRLDFETPPLAVARRMGEEGMERARMGAEREDAGFTQRAMAFVLDYLGEHGEADSETITDACKASGLVPREDRAFGAVYSTLSRRKEIEFAGFCLRRKGHGTAGGRKWRRAQPA